MATAKSKAMTTKKQDNALFMDDRPDYLKNSSRGSENVGAEDLSIPRVDIIQDLSPQRKKNQPEYIEGAEEGMIFNTLTNRLYGDRIYMVPVFYRKEWVIFKDRKAGGGFKGAFASEKEANEAMAQLEDPNNHEVVEVAQNFAVILDENFDPDNPVMEEAVLSMSKSKLKVNRQLNSLIRMAGGDRFSRVYEMSVVQDSGEKGDYYNWKARQLGYAPEAAYRLAESLYDSISSGKRDVNRTAGDVEPAADEGTEY